MSVVIGSHSFEPTKRTDRLAAGVDAPFRRASDVDAFAAAASATATAEWIVCEAPPRGLDARLARQITHEGTPS